MQISQWLTHEQYELQEEIASHKKEGEAVNEGYILFWLINLKKEAETSEYSFQGTS